VSDHICEAHVLQLGTKFAKNLWWDRILLFAFRWRHHVHSTVL